MMCPVSMPDVWLPSRVKLNTFLTTRHSLHETYSLGYFPPFLLKAPYPPGCPDLKSPSSFLSHPNIQSVVKPRVGGVGHGGEGPQVDLSSRSP